MELYQMKPKNIWAVGRNYKKHAEELGNEIPKSPLIFLKSPGCLNFESTIVLPDFSKNIHYECELYIKVGNNLLPETMGLALDLTARDEQDIAKKNGLPWTLAKSFKGACPIGPEYKYTNSEDFKKLSFLFKINGVTVQNGSPQNMIFDLDMLLNFIKDHFPLEPGDLILTGTPEGVGQLLPGQVLTAQIKGFPELTWMVK